ncbi:MAG: hypothetical protein ACYC0J_09320 [Gammaproteobacteria bacterium]
MKNIYQITNKIHEIITKVAFIFIVVFLLILKLVGSNSQKDILMDVQYGLYLLFAPLCILATVYTVQWLIAMIKERNIYFIIGYSAITAITYIISNIHTSQLIYIALGYKPIYVPNTIKVVHIVSVIFIFILTTNTLIVFGSMLFGFVSNIINYVFPVKEILNKSAYILIGSFMVFLSFAFACDAVTRNIDSDRVIQMLAVYVGYYPVSQSASICKEAKKYERFNYLSSNTISVYRYDKTEKRPIFYILNCTAA